MRAWRTQHEPQILRELFDLLSIPNVATDKADIRRNAEALVAMFEQRHFTGGVVPTAGVAAGADGAARAERLAHR